MRPSLLPALLAPGLCAPSAAAAAGFPIAGVDTTRQGATAPGNDFRYVAFAGRHSTLVAKIWRSDGSPQRYRRIRGSFVVLPVAQDATTTGLSADGSTLVLGTPRRRFPARATQLTVVDATTLRPTRTLALRGDFALDGISPDGRRLFLIQYRTGDPTNYAVRA